MSPAIWPKKQRYHIPPLPAQSVKLFSTLSPRRHVTSPRALVRFANKTKIPNYFRARAINRHGQPKGVTLRSLSVSHSDSTPDRLPKVRGSGAVERGGTRRSVPVNPNTH